MTLLPELDSVVAYGFDETNRWAKAGVEPTIERKAAIQVTWSATVSLTILPPGFSISGDGT